MRRLHLQHHDRNDDGNHTVAEGFQAPLIHSDAPWCEPVHFATISVTSSACSPAQRCCTVSSPAPTIACALNLACSCNSAASRDCPNSSPCASHASVTPSV